MFFLLYLLFWPVYPASPHSKGGFVPSLLRSAFAVTCLVILTSMPAFAQSQETRFFRIGTGPTSGTYFPIGGMIANAISNPPGSRECEKGGSCGVPGLIAATQSTSGSVANIEAIASKRLDAALVQADIAYWAYHGTGFYSGKGVVTNLRAVAMLYSDTLQIAVRKDAKIKALADLKGKRVSLGEQGSGTLVTARNLLKAIGLRESDLKAQYLKPGPSADKMKSGEIDALFIVEGAPSPLLADLARAVPLNLLPIPSPEADRLRKTFPFLSKIQIPAETYQNVGAVPSVGVGVVLVAASEAPESLIYGIAKALWHERTQAQLAQNNLRVKLNKLENAIDNIGIPLHAGAASFYFDAGVIK
jgi:TRAP transporter TAXI family solute receptor